MRIRTSAPANVARGLETLALLLLLGGIALLAASCGPEAAVLEPLPDGEDFAPCVITVTSPNGGENWDAGELIPIAWDVSDCGTRVAIELWRDDAFVVTIADSSANDGDYTWIAAQVDSQSTGYSIRVADLASGDDDRSDGVFTITAPPPDDDPTPCAIELASPNGGEDWLEGTEQEITWTVSDCGAQVALQLWRDGSLVAMIADSTDNDGSFAWVAERANGRVDDYRVRVVDLESGKADESDATFTITGDYEPPCVIGVTAPNGGETWVEGNEYLIRWNTSDCGGPVKIELLRDGSLVATLAETTGDDGIFAWTAAQVDGAAAGYKVRVTNLVSGVGDASGASFAIIVEDSAPCVIAVTAPDGGETWIDGHVYPITWYTSDCGSEVSIELLRDDAPVATLAASTANDGSFTWTAAQVDGAESGYKIRVTDLENEIVDASGATFEISVVEPGPDDYYCVSPNGTRTSGSSTSDISSFGWSDADCYGSIAGALAEMGAGDQVWIDDGIYDESIRLREQHAGTENDYSVVRARNAGQVTLHGDDFAMIDLRACSYIEVTGFRITGVGEIPIYVHEQSHHFKITRTGWNQRAGLITDGSHHGLLEDCYAWGGPHRYAFQASNGANRIIFRRCLVRWDFSNTSEPQGCFASYTCDKIYYQNCISIDGTDNKAIDTPSEDGLKSFFTPNGSTDCHYEGCISLAMSGAAGWWLEGTTAVGTLKDCIGWGHLVNAADATDTYDPYTFASTADVGSWTVEQCTFGVNDYGSRPVRFDTYNTETMQNCIIYGMTLDTGEYAVSGDLDDYDYNCYWGNTGGRNNEDGVGPHALTEVNPLDAGLTELIDIDSGSTLATAGVGGGRIGARVMNRIGFDGALYGDPGWDEETGESLWPYPYQDQIRADCAQFSRSAGEAYPGSPAMNGQRGFCAPGENLTDYIRGYLSR